MRVLQLIKSQKIKSDISDHKNSHDNSNNSKNASLKIKIKLMKYLLMNFCIMVI